MQMSGLWKLRESIINIEIFPETLFDFHQRHQNLKKRITKTMGGKASQYHFPTEHEGL
jgi:hypothetical protein